MFKNKLLLTMNLCPVHTNTLCPVHTSDASVTTGPRVYPGQASVIQLGPVVRPPPDLSPDHHTGPAAHRYR